jgi:hypothetical protein
MVYDGIEPILYYPIPKPRKRIDGGLGYRLGIYT